MFSLSAAAATMMPANVSEPPAYALNSHVAVRTQNASVAKNQDIEVENDETHRTETIGKDEHITVGGRARANAAMALNLLPYIEQDADGWHT